MTFVGNYIVADLVFVIAITNLHTETGRGGEIFDLLYKGSVCDFYYLLES